LVVLFLIAVLFSGIVLFPQITPLQKTKETKGRKDDFTPSFFTQPTPHIVSKRNDFLNTLEKK
jgi:hypothetical protein